MMADGKMYATEEKAEAAAEYNRNYIKTIKIEWKV